MKILMCILICFSFSSFVVQAGDGPGTRCQLEDGGMMISNLEFCPKNTKPIK
ncbi:hypothetical protein [Vibrio sp. WXL103]|uniref:hypothetical protein n=1 Tax=unclassified Vibrio TaxID=2614977 RepID=UPI0030E550AD